LRIDEAYLDPRFDKSEEAGTSERTKTILAVPIKDPSGRVLGVCQAINKNKGHFSSDDEAIYQLLANQAGAILKNSQQLEQNLLVHSKLMNLIKVYYVQNENLMIYSLEMRCAKQLICQY